jgi:hypothetical protein
MIGAKKRYLTIAQLLIPNPMTQAQVRNFQAGCSCTKTNAAMNPAAAAVYQVL